MQIITGTDFQLDRDSAVTIGKFDGIHKGHQELLSLILKKKSEGLNATVFTFDQSPSEFFSGNRQPSLTTRDEKRNIFKHLGVDTLIEFPFNKETAATPPEDYINNILCKQMRMKYIAAGDDLSFGHLGKGNTELVSNLSQGRYETEFIDKIYIDGDLVSSTRIRELVAAGELERAAKLIGVPYAVTGNVIHGKRLARKMGFPTANVLLSDEKLAPPFGVYFTEVSVGGKHYQGITNIGCKPTVTDSKQIYAETHLLDFIDDLYGRFMTVKLLKFSRCEQKFASVSELEARIKKDIEEGREYFNEK